MLNVLIHALDVTTLALAVVLLFLLSRRWMMWSVLAIFPVFAIVWYLHVWHSEWLGSLPAVIVDCSTFGLAFLGGHVAINPPTGEEISIKRMYVMSFIALAVIGVVANVWQRNVEKSKQDVLQTAQTAAEIRFSADLKDVKESSTTSRNTILAFVANPPSGYTVEQLSAFAKTLLANSAKAAQPPVTIMPPQAQTAAPARYQPPMRPTISSVPAMFMDGQITGRNFGASPAELHIVVRVKPSAQHGDYGSEGRVGPNNVLGNLRGVNEPLIDPGIIQQWSNTAITLKFPRGYWQGLLNQIASVAQSRNLLPPQQSDLEVGYYIIVDSDFKSGIVYAQ